MIFVVGGEPDALVMAFDKHSGEELWKSLEPRTEMGYSQLRIIEAGGARQLIVWHPWGLSALDPETGALYWEEPFPGGQAPIADPVRSGSYLLVSGFYTASMMMRLSPDRPTATLLWKDEGSDRILEDGVEVAEADGLHSNITTPLLVGDTIYGIGSHGYVRGLRADTGERIWEAEGLTARGRWASAHFVRHEDRYFVYTTRTAPSSSPASRRRATSSSTGRTYCGRPRGPATARRSPARERDDAMGTATARSSGPIPPSPIATSCCGTTRKSSGYRWTNRTTSVIPRRRIPPCPQ